MTEPEHFVVERGRTIALEFDGWKIAHTDSRYPKGRITSNPRDNDQRVRWNETVIYRTTTNKWVVVSIGRSRHSGERDLVKTEVCTEPIEVQAAVRVPNGTITATSAEALRQAAAADPRLAAITAEHV